MDLMTDWGEPKTGGIAGDRRVDRRYRVELELRWKLIRRKKVQDSGLGRTIDLSSGGVLFNAGRPMPVGFNVDLSISWPVLLHNVAPLQLVVTGRIVRCSADQVALRIVQHEFRTVKVPAEGREAIAKSSGTTHFFPRNQRSAMGA